MFPCFCAILAILHLCLLRYFTSTNLVDCADNYYMSLYFYFSSFSTFIQSRMLKLVVICSCCSFLFLLSIFFILLFATLLYIPCSVFSLCLFSLFSDPPYGFLFRSVILSFLFSYYSVLSTSPLCSAPIQSLLFLLYSLHDFRYLFLILLCYLFCSCFCFLYTSSFGALLFGKDLLHFLFCVPFFLSLFSLSLYSLSVLFTLPFFAFVSIL